MRMKLIVIYLLSMIISVVVTYWSIDLFSHDNSPYERLVKENNSATEDMECLAEIFECSKREIMELEKYYNQIEDWNFLDVSYWAIKERKEVLYLCWNNSGYINQAYVLETDFPLKTFLEFCMEDKNLSRDSFCQVFIWGKLTPLQESFQEQQFLQIFIYGWSEPNATFLYHPRGPLESITGGGRRKEIKKLENNWYGSVTQPNWGREY